VKSSDDEFRDQAAAILGASELDRPPEAKAVKPLKVATFEC
jgi:hypothetical protein